MNILAKGEQVIDFLTNNESLISGELKRVEISNQENQLNIELSISLMYSKKVKEVIIRFVGVTEYSFFYSNINNFYFIEEYKFFKKEGLFYISLDPLNVSEDKKESGDNNYILANDVTLCSKI